VSEVITAVESFENAPKGNNIRFEASEETYDFEFINKTKISSKYLLSKVEKILKDWDYKGKSIDFPTIFSSKGETVLSIGLDVRNFGDAVKGLATLTGFSISRKYEKSKELADYMLEIFKPES
jgi:hypothetical protein